MQNSELEMSHAQNSINHIHREPLIVLDASSCNNVRNALQIVYMILQSPSDGQCMGVHLQHEIFILDTNLVNALDQNRMDFITNSLIDALLDALRMEKLGALNIYPATDERAPGWSFIQPITTSHISGHYFEKPGKHPHIRMDFYSCKTVHWRKVISIVHQHLNLGTWRANFIDRQIDEEMQRTIMDISGKGNVVLSEYDIQVGMHHQNSKVEPVL